jgi:vacuolar-type H+-ATPase subunit C/Vma6
LHDRLLTDVTFREVDRVEDLGALVKALRNTAYGGFVSPRESSAEGVELGIGRTAAARLATLLRWAGSDPEALYPIMLALDVQSVRAILRGILGAVPPERRLPGAVPTPTLGRRSLETLSRSDSVGSVAAALTAWGHPLGSDLLAEAHKVKPDALRMELALIGSFAREASKVARDDRVMIRFVREAIDARNVLTALQLSAMRLEGAAGELFVTGGTALQLGAFVRVATTPKAPASMEILAREMKPSPLARALLPPFPGMAELSERIEAIRLEWLRREALVDPLTAAPVLLFVLSSSREAQRLRRALWRVRFARRVVS